MVLDECPSRTSTLVDVGEGKFSGMFAPLNSGMPPKRRALMAASLALHALVFAWLLRVPEPLLLNPTSVALGKNGRVVSQLYFPTPSPDDSDTSSPRHATEQYRHQRFGHEKLILNQNLAKLPKPPVMLAPSAAEDKSQTPTLSSLGHGAPAGLPYGTLPGGPIYGDEIRPALPVATVDPVVYPWELPEAEGNVVVEITIDERGDIVRKSILHSMGPKLDERFLAALDKWRFNPATRNGAAIASKQDAVFHFKARG
jgi:TonB family protein